MSLFQWLLLIGFIAILVLAYLTFRQDANLYQQLQYQCGQGVQKACDYLASHNFPFK